jgi:hypothetical protein
MFPLPSDTIKVSVHAKRRGTIFMVPKSVRKVRKPLKNLKHYIIFLKFMEFRIFLWNDSTPD